MMKKPYRYFLIVLAAWLLQSLHPVAADEGRILGQWSDGMWYPAYVTGRTDGGYQLSYEDGDQAVVDRHQIRPFSWRVGTRVFCRWQKGEFYYPGTIAEMTQADIEIHYDDGDQEHSHVRYCRSQYAEQGTVRGLPGDDHGTYRIYKDDIYGGN